MVQAIPSPVAPTLTAAMDISGLSAVGSCRGVVALASKKLVLSCLAAVPSGVARYGTGTHLIYFCDKCKIQSRS